MKYNKKVLYILCGILFLALWFWPIYCFRNYISFDKVKFTEEWIKTFITSIVLVLGFQYLGKQIKNNKTKNSIKHISENLNYILNVLTKYNNVNNITIDDLNIIHEQLEQLSIAKSSFACDFSSEILFARRMINQAKSGIYSITENDKDRLIENLKNILKSLQDD